MTRYILIDEMSDFIQLTNVKANTPNGIVYIVGMKKKRTIIGSNIEHHVLTPISIEFHTTNISAKNKIVIALNMAEYKLNKKMSDRKILKIMKDLIKIGVSTSEIKTFKEDKCVICFDNEPKSIFYKCGHMAVCDECVKHLDKQQCPMCRCSDKLLLEQYEMNENPTTKWGKKIYDIIKDNKIVSKEWSNDSDSDDE